MVLRYPFLYGGYLVGLGVALTSGRINRIIRGNFNLGTLKKGFTMGPAVLLPPMMCTGYHELKSKADILLAKRDTCPLCLMLKSGVVTALCAVVYPFVVTLTTCIPTARENYTMSFPEGKGRWGFFNLVRKVSPPSTTLMGLALLNVFLGAYVTKRQLDVFQNYLLKPPSQDETEMFLDLTQNKSD